MTNPRYRQYSAFLRQKYGEKVYKLPVNLPGSCPNRDGTMGRGGCIFCDEQGAGFECLPSAWSVRQQLERNRAFFRKRFNAERFIAYFQAFTNTYFPLAQFREYMEAAAEAELVGISVSTRPDCVSDPYLDVLLSLAEKGLDIDVELGLQTVNYHTLRRVNRGHTLAEFLDAVLRVKKRGFSVCAHVILNLPGENIDDVIENAKILSAMRVDYVKLHSLYVVKGTELGRQYQHGEIEMITLDDYVSRVVTFLEYLHPETVIQRLVGKGPKEKQLFSNWDTSWWKIKQMIEKRLEDLDTFQGAKCDYLNGAALRRFED
ncbi:TIGR01212 family radical SAM protein [Metallumcola ferriviriculae]|uniref:TIGR01212 family radical SAM protein n=1 Tax=Metallumcola ferriviriculae TaxID=3039180 RepID=A0AAU0UI55_9FIRM|nr:TIGR01212 family radical SAM protein [Desulfitibacteraceae bacterium MK1]